MRYVEEDVMAEKEVREAIEIKNQEIIEKCLKEFGYLNNPRINILFANKCITEAKKTWSEQFVRSVTVEE
jgi:hypothetical protein